MGLADFADILIAAAAVVLPAVVAWIGHLYTAGLKDRDRKATYIAMAVDILKEPPDAETEHLRRWATDIVNHYSEVKMPDVLRDDLVKRSALRQQAMENFDVKIRGLDDPDRRAMQDTATRMNLAQLKKAIPRDDISVTAIKVRLQELGLYRGPLDDDLTPVFFDAVAAFQEKAGLKPADGIFGPDTFRALMPRRGDK